MHLRIDTENRDDALRILSAISPGAKARTTPEPANDGTDQALDYHMEEREFFKQQLGIAGGLIQELIASEREALNEVGEARVFVEKAERLLAGIGVEVAIGDDGEPKLSLNIDELLNYVQGRIQA